MGDFAVQLKKFRKSKRITQAELAAQLGLSQQAVAKWENRHSTPDPQTLKRITEIFEVSADELLGRNSEDPAIAYLPVLGRVKAGYDAFAVQEECGYEPAYGYDPESHFYLIVTGDSMEPRIHSGDLALIHVQQDVLSGELAVVLVDGEESTLKKVIKQNGGIILQAFNSEYEPQFFYGEDANRLRIIGKVLETKTRW